MRNSYETLSEYLPEIEDDPAGPTRLAGHPGVIVETTIYNAFDIPLKILIVEGRSCPRLGAATDQDRLMR